MSSRFEKKNYNPQKGRRAELLVQDYFIENGWTIYDTAKDKNFWGVDIDIIVRKGNKVCRIEVKSDYLIHKSKNLCVEEFRLEDGVSGWLKICKADYLIWVSSVTGDFYIAKPEELREYYYTYKSKTSNSSLDSKKMKIYIQKDALKNGGFHHYVNGLIPINAYEKSGNYFKIISK